MDLCVLDSIVESRVFVCCCSWIKNFRFSHSPLYSCCIVLPKSSRRKKITFILCFSSVTIEFVYYESINRDLNKKRLEYECRCDKRLNSTVEISRRLVYTVLCGDWNTWELERIYYETRKWGVKTRPIYTYRCDERLKTKSEKSTRLGYTGLFGELEHRKIETRLRDEMFDCCLLLIDKGKSKVKTYIWVSVRWKTKTWRWGIYMSQIHWVDRGTGTPKDRNEVNIW